MCFMITADEFKTSDTTLIVSPLRTPPHLPQQWQLTYINSIHRSTSANKSVNNHPLMIVPIPNPHHLLEHQFQLFPLTSSASSNIAKKAHHLTEGYFKDFSLGPSQSNSLFGSSAFPTLNIQTVGSYKIAVAPNFHDLETRAPWKHFSIPPHNLVRILEDLKARYHKRHFAFIIAEGITNHVSNVWSSEKNTTLFTDTGFSVLYQDAGQFGAFFPTSHEAPQSNSSSYPQSLSTITPVLINHFTQMNVRLIAFGALIRPLSLLSPSQLPKVSPSGSHRDVVRIIADDTNIYLPSLSAKWSHATAIHQSLPRLSTKGVQVEHCRPKFVSAWFLDRYVSNGDVLARPTIDNDVQVIWRMYDDLDAWLRNRFQLSTSLGIINQKESKQHILKSNLSLLASSASKKLNPLRSTFGSNEKDVHASYESYFGTNNESVANHSLFGSGSSNFIPGTRNYQTHESNDPFSDTILHSPPMPDNQALQRIDFVLSLLARQLADPGINDRISDVVSPISGERNNCGPVAYCNLDCLDVDLDQEAYSAKDSWSRFVPDKGSSEIDTTNTTYVRVSATLGPLETYDMRTVHNS